MKKLFGFIMGVLFVGAMATAGTAASDQEDFIKVSEKVMPAIVNINTETKVKQRYVDPYEDFYNQFFGYKTQPREIERKSTSLGSGFIISEDGVVITNNHVIDKADKIEVVLADKSKFKAKLIGTDASTDIAVLKIESDKKFKFLELADSDAIKVGQWAIAIGNPYGLNNTMTLGIVSAKGRAGMNIESYENFIQTDASVNPGNSGGPLVDINGRVIGVNTAILSQTGGSVGIGFAIPSNMAKRVSDSIIKNGKVERGFLGISLQPVDETMAKKFGLSKTQGIVIVDVSKGSAAEKGGLKKGDVIVALNDQAVEDYNLFRNEIANTFPNTKIKLDIIRNGKKIEMSVVLGKRADDAATVIDSEILGMTLKTLDAELNQKYGYGKDSTGVAVTAVKTDSDAYEKGIRQGDVISGIENTEVTTLEALNEIYKNVPAGEEIMLYIENKNGGRYVILEKPKK